MVQTLWPDWKSTWSSLVETWSSLVDTWSSLVDTSCFWTDGLFEESPTRLHRLAVLYFLVASQAGVCKMRGERRLGVL